MSRTIELKWNCTSCNSTGIMGRYKRCPNCGSPREKGEMDMSGLHTDNDGDGYNDAVSVTDDDLLNLANQGEDWFCSHCGSGNQDHHDSCNSCGAPRYGTKEEWHPMFSNKNNPQSKDDDIFDSIPTIPKPKISQDALIKVLLGVLSILIISFIIWSRMTHDVTGEIRGVNWTHIITKQTWTAKTIREWKYEANLRPEIKPVNGSGERAGLAYIGNCRQEHHHYEEYQCGTKEESYECGSNKSYQGTCTKSEKYSCGETCSDNGNGFATCRTKYCSRSVSYSCQKTKFVSKTCYRTVPKYCDRSIERTKCSYRTQTWHTNGTYPSKGTDTQSYWQNPVKGELDRFLYSVDYDIDIKYIDFGKQRFKSISNPIGSEPTLESKEAAKKAESRFKKITIGDKIYLKVND